MRRLSDAGVALLDCLHKTPKPALQGHPYIAIPDIRDGRIDLSAVRRITDSDLAEWTARVKPQAGDIIVTRRGRVGDTAVVPPDLDCAIGQNLVILRSDGTHVDQGYLRWALRGPYYRQEVDKYLNVGAVFDSLNCRDIPKFEIAVPSKDVQRAIASILGAFDDKIKLNRQMNETLEAMARAIFKSWFVDFDPVRAKMEGRQPYGMDADTAALFPDTFQDSPLGKIPEGWEASSIYQTSDVVYGAAFSSKLFNEDGIGLPLLRIRDLATHDPKVWTPEEHPKGIEVQPGDIVVGMDGEFRAHFWQGPTSWLNQRVCMFVPKPSIPKPFVLYSIVEPLAFFERSKTGTTVIHLGKRDIDTFRLPVPDRRVLDAFGAVACPLFERLIQNESQSRTLAETREVLLPKLLSGQVRVKP